MLPQGLQMKVGRNWLPCSFETFFGELLILVLMDLSSGYLLLETIQEDRSFDPWFAQASPRLDAMGIRVGHAVSDRAKALIKLAVEGFGCASGADTFHEQYGLSRWLSPALGRRKAKSGQCCEAAQKALESLPSEASGGEYGPLRHPIAPGMSVTGIRLVFALDRAMGLPVLHRPSSCMHAS